jgi:prepilin-type N-terminal cleavage/methylation domain-containing protein
MMKAPFIMRTTIPSFVPRRKGFTLIELLTVIAIIGVLAAILIPAAASVRKSARRAQGTSNLRQIVLASRMIATDNRGKFFWDVNTLSQGGTRRYYMTVISDYLRGASNGGATNAIFLDPIAQPGTFNHFAVNPVFLGSYASSHSMRARYNQLDNVRNPSRSILFGDQAGTYSELQNIGRGGSIWSWLWSNPNPVLASWTHDQLAAPYGSGGGQFDTVRDPGGTKVAFVDGSVRRLTLSQITHGMVDPASN